MLSAMYLSVYKRFDNYILNSSMGQPMARCYRVTAPFFSLGDASVSYGCVLHPLAMRAA